MKQFRKFLRAIIIAGSISGFFGGWVMLAQTTQLAVASNITSSSATDSTHPAITPLPTLDLKSLSPSGAVASNVQQLTVPQVQSQVRVPRLRTHGS